MSTTPLDTNFKDDILASSNAKRKYQMTYNDDGTVSFQDVTAYSQMGSAFGAKEVNEERAAINKINSDRIVTLDEIDLVTEPGFFVDAMAVKQLNRNFANVLGILTNIKGIYVGSKIAACNQAYALLHDTASLTKILGKAPTASNFICMVMNGDANAAQTSYYSPRYYSGDGLYVYVYPNVTGSIRINYVIFAIE